MAELVPVSAGNLLGVQVIKSAKIGAGVNVEQGKIYVFVEGYLKVPAVANAATGKRPVRALSSADNTSGDDGDLSVDVEYGFWVDMANDGMHPITQADVGVSPGYLSSATTVSTNSADGPPIGQGSAPAVISFNATNSVYGRPVRVEIK